ncbi:hypothetical protein E2562_005821 [Oryza meyeriana var. granulata]|uniref:Uncharacterized protein n=1 Tax=Oryza meyeriana var. granulata TaxID=110450 RepID=A0A6G1CEN4_9ORYZ|nr:hypothetical protein E2562_005821 [Oryza meyeriana var. granulata]
MGEPTVDAPPELSSPDASESSDASASDQNSEEQKGSPVHTDELLEARDSPQRDDAGPRPPRVDYTHYKAVRMRRLRLVLEADWFLTARHPHAIWRTLIARKGVKEGVTVVMQ